MAEHKPGQHGPDLEATQKKYNERIQKLSSRLSDLQTSLAQERVIRFEELSRRMAALDETFHKNQAHNQHKLQKLKETIAANFKTHEEEKRLREQLVADKDKELASIDQRLQRALEAEQNMRREAEVKILQMFETQTQKLRDDIAKEGKERVAMEVNLRKYLDVDIPKLHLALSEEIQARELMEERILKRARDEVMRLNEEIAAEKKARQETEEAMTRMIEDIVVKMQQELLQERKEREQDEEMLLKILEDTCIRLNSAAAVI